jgi:hypothetical protein
MRRTVLFVTLLAVVLLAGGIVLSALPASAHGQQPQGKPTEIVQGDSKQVLSPDTALGYSQQVSNIYCYAPDPTQNTCYINTRFAHFGATDPDYISYVKVGIDGKMVLKMMTVFENDMYLSYDQNPNGYKVACGTAGESGSADPKVGHVYNVSEEAFKYPDSFVMGYYMMVSCPAYAPTQP